MKKCIGIFLLICYLNVEYGYANSYSTKKYNLSPVSEFNQESSAISNSILQEMQIQSRESFIEIIISMLKENIYFLEYKKKNKLDHSFVEEFSNAVANTFIPVLLSFNYVIKHCKQFFKESVDQRLFIKNLNKYFILIFILFFTIPVFTQISDKSLLYEQKYTTYAANKILNVFEVDEKKVVDVNSEKTVLDARNDKTEKRMVESDDKTLSFDSQIKNIEKTGDVKAFHKLQKLFRSSEDKDLINKLKDMFKFLDVSAFTKLLNEKYNGEVFQILFSLTTQFQNDNALSYLKEMKVPVLSEIAEFNGNHNLYISNLLTYLASSAIENTHAEYLIINYSMEYFQDKQDAMSLSSLRRLARRGNYDAEYLLTKFIPDDLSSLLINYSAFKRYFNSNPIVDSVFGNHELAFEIGSAYDSEQISVAILNFIDFNSKTFFHNNPDSWKNLKGLNKELFDLMNYNEQYEIENCLNTIALREMKQKDIPLQATKAYNLMKKWGLLPNSESVGSLTANDYNISDSGKYYHDYHEQYRPEYENNNYRDVQENHSYYREVVSGDNRYDGDEDRVLNQREIIDDLNQIIDDNNTYIYERNVLEEDMLPPYIMNPLEFIADYAYSLENFLFLINNLFDRISESQRKEILFHADFAVYLNNIAGKNSEWFFNDLDFSNNFNLNAEDIIFYYFYDSYEKLNHILNEYQPWLMDFVGSDSEFLSVNITYPLEFIADYADNFDHFYELLNIYFSNFSDIQQDYILKHQDFRLCLVSVFNDHPEWINALETENLLDFNQNNSSFFNQAA